MVYRIIKRAFDLFCCLLGFPFFLVIIFFVYIAIKCDDGGPVFYKAERIGRNCKKFFMLKFRSMKVNSENILNPDGSTYNAKDDPRVTRIGHFLRETSIDEIPQLLNVLIGDMSAVGPRASGWGALPTYKPDEMGKMKVRPGITGYTQAYFRNSLSVREKRLKDVWYADNATVLLDIKIIFRTVVTVLKRENVFTNELTKKETADTRERTIAK